MRTVSPQQQHAPSPWVRVGLVADRLPVATQAYARPAEETEPADETLRSVVRNGGIYIGVPPRHTAITADSGPCIALPRARAQVFAGPPDPHEGMPGMTEAQLMLAHRRCCCARRTEEAHTLAEWDAIELEARQRAFAADPVAVAAETEEIARANYLAAKREQGAA